MSWKPFTTRALCALLCVTFWGAASENPPSEERSQPSILLVTFDTTRADRIGAYGYGAAATPTLDRLARGGVLFETALAPTPTTLPSHASILTGVYPTAHGVRDNGVFILAPGATLLSEVLRERGWRTGAFVGAYVLDSKFGLDQGFEVYRDAALTHMGTSDYAERRADAVVADALHWFESIGPDERFFAWVHFYDPHAPYNPPEPWNKRHTDPYDAEIAFSDAQLDRLLHYLSTNGLAKNLLVVATSDHAESHGEHGEQSHGMLLYDATLRVPLIVSGPPVAASKGSRVAHPISSAALAPTLLTLAGIPASAMPAVKIPSLFSADGVPTHSAPSVYGETHAPYYTAGWHALRGLRRGSTTLIEGHGSELYDLANDPKQLHDLAGAQPRDLESMQEELQSLVTAHRALDWATSAQPSAKDRRLLAALGYTVGDDLAGDPFDPSLADPKEKVGEFESIGAAQALIVRAQAISAQPAATAWQRGERDAEARKVLEEAHKLLAPVYESSPGNSLALGVLGVIERRLGNTDAAIARFERFVSMRPFDTVYRYRLATALYDDGRFDDALREVRTVIAQDPEFSAASEWMFQYHVSREEFGRASWWVRDELSKTIEGSPRHVELTNRLIGSNAQMRKRNQTETPPADLEEQRP